MLVYLSVHLAEPVRYSGIMGSPRLFARVLYPFLGHINLLRDLVCVMIKWLVLRKKKKLVELLTMAKSLFRERKRSG